MRITDPHNLTCSLDFPLRDILQQLVDQPKTTLIVLDEDDKVVGTITDGDVRRAILKDMDLSVHARDVMKSTPKLGHQGQDDENTAMLASLAASEPALPIIDADGRLVEVLLGSPTAAFADALVMAGGFGRRLKDKTHDTPKPLLPVGGKPILEHILSRLEAAGAAHIYISVHFLADQIEAFVASRNNKAEITFLHESEPLGTAGAITCLPDVGSRTVLLVNGDVLTNLVFANLANFHESGGFDVTIAAAIYEVEIPFGVLRFSDDGQFLEVDEKPTLNNFVAAGIYALSPQAQKLVPADVITDVPDLIASAKAANMLVGVFPIHEYWTDVGHPSDLDEAHEYYQNNETSANKDP